MDAPPRATGASCVMLALRGGGTMVPLRIRRAQPSAAKVRAAVERLAGRGGELR